MLRRQRHVNSQCKRVPSGKHTKNYGESPFLMGKSTISMAIFNCYVSSPEGRQPFSSICRILGPNFPETTHTSPENKRKFGVWMTWNQEKERKRYHRVPSNPLNFPCKSPCSPMFFPAKVCPELWLRHEGSAKGKFICS